MFFQNTRQVVCLDLKTGEVKKRRSGDGPPIGGHARCYRNKATERFLVLGGTGIELVDLADGSWTSDPWVRGTCQYGVMPANGMLYVPPDSCACLPNARLHGFTAMAPAGVDAQTAKDKRDRAERLERGPAYGQIAATALSATAGVDDWPTYRNDSARSGRTRSTVSPELQPAWQTNLGGQLTSLTAAAGKVCVARVDAHTVFALDVESGDVAWSRAVGGPVDSPPTFCRGLVVFGCRDGWVYCLRASDGLDNQGLAELRALKPGLLWAVSAADGKFLADRQLRAAPVFDGMAAIPGRVLVSCTDGSWPTTDQ